MRLFLKFIIVLFPLLLSAGCSSSELFTLAPDKEKTDTEDGTEIAFLEDDLVYSNIEFVDEFNGKYIFYLFVFNKSDEKINIDPAEIKMIAFDENKKPIPKKNTFYAIDPALMIGELEENINNRKTEHAVSTGFNFIFALINTAADLSNNNKNDVAEVFENAAIFAENQVIEEINYSADVDYLKSQKSMWEYDVLPKIQLNSQDDIGGLVFIPASRDAEYLKIIIPFDSTKHTYFFKKEKISVD